MSSRVLSIAFVLDISKSMDEQYGYVGKKVEIAKQIVKVFISLSDLILNIRELYRFYLYVFPSLIPDVRPCEEIHRQIIFNTQTLENLQKVVDSIVETRPTTPLIESLICVANDLDMNGFIIVITDGVYVKISNEKLSELRNIIEEKKLYIIVLCLNKNLEDLMKISSDRIEVEILYASDLYSVLLNNTLKKLIQTKILPRIEKQV